MKKIPRLCGVLLSVVVLLVLLLPARESTAPVRLYFLDVGQGDATLIRTPDGDVLIDTGTNASERELMLRLKRLGVQKLRLLVLSHADEDHVGGADAVLSSLSVEEVWIGADTDFGEPFLRVLEEIRARQIPLYSPVAEEVRSIGTLVFEILSPMLHTGWKGNNGSLVFRFCYGNLRVLFMGDVESDVEEEICLRYASRLACDVYKVPHHGAATNAGHRVAEAASPQYAVIFCSGDNSYGHPHGQQLELLHSVGASVLRTDRLGEILIEYDGTEVRYVP